MKPSSPPNNKPLTTGHRQRLKKRFMRDKGKSMDDYELLELLLTFSIPRRDVKPLAKQLLNTFTNIAGVLTAEDEKLKHISGLGPNSIVLFKTILSLSSRVLQQNIEHKHIIASWQDMIDYCQILMKHEKKEQVRVLYLDHRHHLLCDELQQTGTVNHSTIYPREILKRALDLGASGIILVHNHPTGNSKPSKEDIAVTQTIYQASMHLGIKLHDHLIVAGNNITSFRSHGLLLS